MFACKTISSSDDKAETNLMTGQKQSYFDYMNPNCDLGLDSKTSFLQDTDS